MMKDMSKNSVSQISAQIGIIVILITAAVLTFGLSVANRVVQENKVVVDRSDSIRTFNTAETGVDEALNQIYLYETGDITTLPSGDILPSDDYSQVSIATNDTYEGYLGQGESLRIDLNTGGGDINLSWSKTLCAINYRVGLLLTLLHTDASGEYQSFYYLIGDEACLYSGAQNFIDVDVDNAATYKYSYTLTIPALASTNASLYIQTVGAGSDLQIAGSTNFISNAQYTIESLAKSENEVSYKTIEVDKSLPSAPGFMTFALFSGGTITK